MRHSHHHIIQNSGGWTTQKQLAVGLGVGFFLLVVIVIAVIATIQVTSGGSAPIEPTRPASMPVTPIPAITTCSPIYPPDPDGFAIRQVNSMGENAIIISTGDTSNLNLYGNGFAISYWTRFPTLSLGSDPVTLDMWSRTASFGKLFQLTLTAIPALPGPTTMATVSITATFDIPFNAVYNYNDPQVIDLSQFNHIVCQFSVDNPPDNNTITVTGFQAWVNAVEYFGSQSTIEPPTIPSQPAGTRPPWPALLPVTFPRLSDVPLRTGTNVSPETVDFRLLSMFYKTLTNGEVGLLFQDKNSNAYAQSIFAFATYLLGKGDTSYGAVYSERFPSCVPGIIFGDVYVVSS